MSNIFELCPTHFSKGEEEKIVGVFAHPGYWLGQSRDREDSDTLSASAQFRLCSLLCLQRQVAKLA